MKKMIYILPAFVCLALAGCSSAQKHADEEFIGERTLEKTKWIFVKFGEEEVTPADENKPSYIEFEGDSKRIFGHLGCNTFTGQYEIDADNSIFIKGIASTKMMCPDMKAEEALKKILQQSRSLRITGNTLYLLEYERVIAEFRGS